MSDSDRGLATGTRIRQHAWYHPTALARGIAMRPRLYTAVAVAALAIFVMPSWMSLNARAVIGWDAGALVYLVASFYLMSRCSMETIRKQAVREDETRFVFALLILLAVASSFSAVVGLIGEAKATKDQIRALYFSLAGLSIFCSWLVMQIVFTLHYAHEYYRPAHASGSAVRGLAFPEDDHPDYWDFFYFTTSIGATSQTSDVMVTSKALRRIVTFQAIVTFVFNTVVIALAINLAAGLF